MAAIAALNRWFSTRILSTSQNRIAPVYSLLERKEDEIQSIVAQDIPNWEEEPLDVLEEICQTVFQIQEGIAAIEPYWKLTG